MAKVIEKAGESVMESSILVLGGASYNSPFNSFGHCINHWPAVDDDIEDMMLGIEVVVFTGGADVDPSLYGEQRIRATSVSQCNRDIAEGRYYEYCVDNDIPMTGICRGSQFLTVMNGGKLVQDIRHHGIASTHEITYKVQKCRTVVYLEHVQVTSTHHQMMYPFNLPTGEYEVLAHAKGLSHIYEGVPKIEEKLRHLDKSVTLETIEPEAVLYPLTACLCVQFHPEMMEESSGGFQYYQSLLKQYIFN